MEFEMIEENNCSDNPIPLEDLLSHYNYELPDELIAQKPLPRGEERLLVLKKNGGACTHMMFADLPSLLPKDAILVANNSKVMPVRILGSKQTGGHIECLLLDPVPFIERDAVAISEFDDCFYAITSVLLKPSKFFKIAETVFFPSEDAEDRIKINILEKMEFGRCLAKIEWHGGRHGLTSFLERNGVIPLPPYIKRDATVSDCETYQTVYARSDKQGSVAAPTAGLHFTDEMRRRLQNLGFGWVEATLHVGYGTFAPVREQDIRYHVMHSEYIECTEDVANKINDAKKHGRPIIAVGTTSCRILEGIAQVCGRIAPYQGWTNIFIRPPYKWQVVDGLITNFHTPESTLLMLVAAMAGYDEIMNAYKEAINARYRFFSYGDAMLIC